MADVTWSARRLLGSTVNTSTGTAWQTDRAARAARRRSRRLAHGRPEGEASWRLWADKKLTEIAEAQVNPQALEGEAGAAAKGGAAARTRQR
jgi:hypothetical protein